jgi:hypothetical protein
LGEVINAKSYRLQERLTDKHITGDQENSLEPQPIYIYTTILK